MKNEIDQEKKGNTKYKKSIKKSFTLEKMFLEPSYDKQGLVFGDTHSKQKNKVYKDMKLDLNEEYMSNKKETNNENNMLNKQNDKIKDLINNFMNEALCEENEDDMDIDIVKKPENNTKDRRVSVLNPIAYQKLTNLEGVHNKKKTKNPIKPEMNEKEDTNNNSNNVITDKKILNRKSFLKPINSNNLFLNETNNSPSPKFILNSSEAKKNRKKEATIKNNNIDNNKKNFNNEKDITNDFAKSKKKVDNLTSNKRRSILLKDNEKFFNKLFNHNITENQIHSDSENNNNDQVDSTSEHEVSFSSPIKIKKDVKNTFDSVSTNNANDTASTHKVSNRRQSLMNIITKNNNLELNEEKINNLNNNKSPKGDCINIDKSNNENGDLFNVALNSIIKKKLAIKDNHISNRSESPLVENNIKNNQDICAKNFSTNSTSNKNLKPENNNNLNNEEEISDKKRKVRKIRLVCDSLSEDEEEFELSTITNYCLLIYPDSFFLYIWEKLIYIINLYFMIMIPFYVAFGYSDSSFVLWFELFGDLIYIIDLMLNFNIPFKDFNENIVLNHKFIFVNYLGSWFTIDFISAIPANTVYFLKENPFIRCIKLLKILKVYYSQDDRKEQENKIEYMENFNLTSAEIRIIRFTLTLFVSVHILACLWIYIGKLDFPNWLINSELSSQGNFDIYVASVYFILTTIFTIGYGDILSVSSSERVYNILIMAIGVLIYSFAISSLSTVISSYDTVTTKYLNNLNILEDMARLYPGINGNLYLKVQKFINYDFKFNKTDRYAFIGELPNITRNDLLYDMYKNMISNFSFFKHGMKYNNEHFNSKIVLKMRPVRLFKGDIILRENDRVNEMIFVNQGYASAQLTYNNQTAKIFKLRKFDHFGDIFVLSNDGCPVDLVVKSKTCELYIIKKEDLLEIAKEYPEICNEIFRVSNTNYIRMKVLIDEKKKKLGYDMENIEEKKENVESESLDSNKNSFSFCENEEDELKEDEKNKEEKKDKDEKEVDINENKEEKKIQEKTKDKITTLNLDIIQETDENEEIKGENDNEIHEDIHVLMIKKINEHIQNTDIKENSRISNEKKKLKNVSFKETLDIQSKETNIIKKDIILPFNDSIANKNEEESPEYHEPSHNSINLTSKLVSKKKEDNNLTNLNDANSLGHEETNKNENTEGIHERLQNEKQNSLNLPKDNIKENGNFNKTFDSMDFKNNFIDPSFKRHYSVQPIENGGEKFLKNESYKYDSFSTNYPTSKNINSNINFEIEDNNTLDNTKDLKLLDKFSLKNKNSELISDNKDIKFNEEENKGGLLEINVKNGNGSKRLQTTFTLIGKETDNKKELARDRYKSDVTISLNNFKLNRKFNKTTIASDDIDSQKKNSILKYSETKKFIDPKGTKKNDTLKKKKNLIKNIQSHIEASVKIEKDPTTFMIKELNKVEKKLIGYKRKEIKDLIIKLDEIYDLLSKF